ncbi:MAG TPA: alpha-amylase family glycosyl hydrolase [Mycobacteriales bacterium]|nr:alpha-amylase family glycosyl hydrolase [Mycobacteriales bacterium]
MAAPAAPWWREAVVYEVYLRSFADSDGDGLGDLAGLRSRLPYLRDLGVDAVWITPFYPSPMADHGYDVADYCDVDPRFGDLDAFDRVLAEAHELGLRVIVDVVPNHTSSAHPWFQEALADPDSPARARYWFRDGAGPQGSAPPNNWQSVFGGPAWTRDEASGQWYLHMFDSAQPDLDWANREVHEEFLRVLRFWLDRGVDGFRIDVAHSLYVRADLADDPSVGVEKGMHEDDHRHIWDQEEVLAVYEEWRELLDSYPGERMLVGEVFLFDVPRVARYVGTDRLHQAFNFTVFQARWDAADLRRVLVDALEHFDPGTWVLSNHDLTRHATRYGGGDLGRRRGLAVTAFLLALPGSPYLYQGEELGLEETDVPEHLREDPVFLRTGGALAGRDGCRTPVPWTAEAPGHGFTTGRPWLPFGPEASTHAVELQAADPASVLTAYRRLLARRRALLSELADLTWLPAQDDVLAVRRGPLVAVLSTAGEPVEVPVDGAVELLEATAAGAALDDGLVTVPAAATVWVRVGSSPS